MAKRRPSGGGMVRKREDGRWESRIVVGHKQNGEPIFRYVLAKTQKELLDKLHRDLGAFQDVEHRGQPHDTGRMAGPVDGGLRRGHPAEL